MAIKPLLRMGDERLYQVAKRIENLQDPELQIIIDDLIDSMRHYGGVGIAGPQIGFFYRVFVYEVNNNIRYPEAPNIPLHVVINPEVEFLENESVGLWESCLSVPGYRGLVPRYRRVRCQGYDREGQFFQRELEGFAAHIIQHETDHLNGVLYPMKIEDMRNWGCDDTIWSRYSDEPYPEGRWQDLKTQWGF